MKPRGITLVEIVTVLSIMSVASIIALPPLLQWRENAKIGGMAAQLTASLQRARHYALTNQDNVAITFDRDHYMIFVDDGYGGAISGDWLKSGSERVLCLQKYPAGILVSTNFPHDRFRFKGFGRNMPGTILLSTFHGSNIALKVNAIGRIRSEGD